ncbi:uncharacterized protein LOC136081218 [Hydra vulgaris]|uniref:Uncharacterized protein LOC136081218 n=1 Tax=Hydra vulgaris TaxID=6087 RepID=A0ABM4BZB4_HYDVU
MKWQQCPASGLKILAVFCGQILELSGKKSGKEKERLAEENSDLSLAEDGSRVVYAPSRFNSQEFSHPPAKIRKIILNSHTTLSLNNPLFPVTPSLASRPPLIQTSTSLPTTSNCQTTSLLNYPLFPDKSAPASELSFSNSIQTQASLHCSLPCEHHCTHVVAWFEKLFREIQQMSIEQEAINRRFHQHSQCQIESHLVDSNFLNCLPLDSDLDFDQFGMEIDTDKEKRTALISYLRKRSDTNVNKTIINILRSLLKDNVLGCYSRDGKRGQKSFALAKGNFVSIIQGNIYLINNN